MKSCGTTAKKMICAVWVAAWAAGCAKSPPAPRINGPTPIVATQTKESLPPQEDGKPEPVLGLLGSKASMVNDGATHIFPHSVKSSSTQIFTIDIEALKDRGTLLAVVSLQGLVNRDFPRIVLKQKQTSWLLDYYKSQRLVTHENIYSDPYKLIADFMTDVVKGAVVIDPSRPYTINLATNIAGVEDRIIISPEMIPRIRALGITDIEDLRANKFVDEADAYRWVYDTFYPRQRHDLLCVSFYARYNDLRRDYLIAFRVPTFWLPAASDPDYTSAIEDHVNQLLSHAPVNIPILGWWQGTEGARGKKRGIGEEAGARLAGMYGKFVVADDFVANYSYHAAIDLGLSPLKQENSGKNPVPPFDPDKKYVALTLVDSGYAAWYWQSAFPELWWNQKERGQVALSYGIAPLLYDLAPGLVAYLYHSATRNDYFFAALSGMGYSYPFDHYGQKAQLLPDGVSFAKSDDVLAAYLDKSARILKAMDLSALALYTHPWQAWDQSDDDLVKRVIVPHIAGIRSLLAGMERDEGFSAATGSSMLDRGVTMHHTLTRAPPATLIDAASYADLRKDKAAVRWLADEIRSQAREGNFIQAMAQSWIYGPRRLKMLSDLLQDEGYIFVTLDTFDAIFRASLQRRP